MMKSITREKVFHVLKLVLLAVTVTLVLLSLLGTVAHASGLVDDTVNADNLYSKYPLSNYQLDFYVDNSWSWLPWNWLDGIGKSVQYGLYCITNFVWTISLYLSNATGYVVQQAYKLDFINDMADSIGKSIQTLAGVTEHGFSSSGFYVGFLLIIILIVGVYTAYTGLLKRETSKALHAVINFVVVFIVSASFIAYAPNYIQKINDFSSDISTASLDLGTKIMLPDSQSKGKDSVDLIRDSLFAIQVEKPWLLLQFGNSDTEEIGADRVEALVSASPSDEDGETRENVVKTEIEDNDNDNLTIPQVVNRLGMVFFLLIFNLGITIFIFLLTGMMLFSQILFIIYAMFLPISFLLSMIPTYENMAKQAVVRVFNAIMTRAGITLIVTVAFSISSMFYNISTDYPFFMVAFLQIICFAGIYMKLAFDRAIVLGIAKKNPSRMIGNIKSKKTKVDFWTLEEFQKVISLLCKKDYYEHYLFISFWLLFMTGMRIGEASALHWSDIDFETGLLSITKTLYYRTMTDYKFVEPKTQASIRTIYIDSDTLNELKAWQSVQQQVLPDCPLVLSYNGTPTSKTTLPRALEKLSNLAGVHRIKIHALRHSHASLLISMGENPLLIKERLGHEKIQTTLGTYGHLYPNTNLEVAKKLTGILQVQSATESIANYTSNQHTAIYHRTVEEK